MGRLCEKITEDELYSEYVVNKMNVTDIATKYGCSRQNITIRLNRMGVYKPSATVKSEQAKTLQPKIVKLYVDNGKSVKYLMKAFDVPRSVIVEALNNANVFDSTRRGKIKFTKADRKTMLDKYLNQGMTIRQIATEYKCSQNTVVKFLDCAGNEIAEQREKAYKDHMQMYVGKAGIWYDEPTRAAMLKDYIEHKLTYRQIQLKYGCSQQTFNRILKNTNLYSAEEIRKAVEEHRSKSGRRGPRK